MPGFEGPVGEDLKLTDAYAFKLPGLRIQQALLIEKAREPAKFMAVRSYSCAIGLSVNR